MQQNSDLSKYVNEVSYFIIEIIVIAKFVLMIWIIMPIKMNKLKITHKIKEIEILIFLYW